MAVRPIDGNELVDTLKQIISDYTSQGMYPSAFPIEYAIEIVEEMPTLAPPNETPPCYQPDGDGCAYQCYDGQDEPIEKCKACPLCYSDKQRHYTPPNEPLTCDGCRWEITEPFGKCGKCIRERIGERTDNYECSRRE